MMQITEQQRWSEGFKKQITGIEQSRYMTFAQFLVFMNPMIGDIDGQKISYIFNGDITALENALLSGFDLPQIEKSLSESIVDWFDNPINCDLWNQMKLEIRFIKPNPIEHPVVAAQPKTVAKHLPSTLTNKEIVVTGVLSTMTRSEVKTFIEARGGQMQKSVTNSTDCVVVGKKPGKRKVNDAILRRIPQLTEQEFLDIANS